MRSEEERREIRVVCDRLESCVMVSKESSVPWGLGLILLLSLVLTIPWLDRPFHTRGEPREAIIAQSMVMGGSWISPPAYNGAVPSKPPFSHWLIALTSLPLGEVTEVTARLPSAVAFVAFSLAFYLFLARRVSQESAVLACLILLSSAEWFRSGVTCRVDLILSTSLAGALLALFSWSERGHKGFPWLAALLATCAALTKGPIGVALPLMIFALYEFVVSEKGFNRTVVIGLRCIGIGIPVMALVSTWYVAGYLERGDAFLEKIWYENFARLTSSMDDEPHKHSALYLLGMLLVGLLPWTIVWGCALLGSLRSQTGIKRSVTELWAKSTKLQRFAFISALTIVLFFCIPSSKRSVYILPAYPFLAIMAAESLRVWGQRTDRLMNILARWIKGFVAVVCAGVIIAALFPFREELERFRGSIVESLTVWRPATLAVLVVFGVKVFRGRRVGAGAHGLALSLIGAVAVISTVVTEPVFHQLSPKAWLKSPQFRATVDPLKHERMYSFGSEAYAASFYLQKPFFSLSPAVSVSPGSVVFVEQRNVGRLSAEMGLNVREVGRFSSGLEASKKNLVALEVVEAR